MKFEEGIKRLEEIVKLLERGDLPLEEALKLFEEGISLSEKLKKFLEESERKVKILIEKGEGLIEEEPFDLPDED